MPEERDTTVTETVRSREATLEVGEVHTFLIADVRGYTRFTVEHGDEAAARLAGRFAALAREGVAARGGAVIELRGDEALAVFSSARQALRAAVELQARFRQETEADRALPLEAGIGLDAGEAIPVEGGFRGGALNLAARLCSLAGPGEVLASEGVVHLARKMEGLEFAERGSVDLKGFADRVRVVEVRPSLPGTRSAEEETDSLLPLTRVGVERPLPIGGFLGALPAGVLVAREEELALIAAAVDAVLDGSGRLVLLAGEPGVGKTRLAQEITLVLRNRGFLIAAGRCYEPRRSVPFYPFLDALAALYVDCPSALRSQLPRRWPYLARLLPDTELTAPVASSEEMEEQERLFRAVTGFIQAIAEAAPIALLFDDLHWADSASLELLQHLARHTRGDRVFLLGTYRDVEVGRQHPLEGVLRELTRERLVEEVPVRRLAQEGTAALTAATFGESEISNEFAELLQRHTEGNPFFVQEVLRALVERGDIYRENGRWERREIEELEVPKSVRSAIGERLSRLDEGAQEILYEASVLGQSFGFDDLRLMSDRTEQAVEQALEAATVAGLIRETGRDAFAFNHALTQQALYAELSGRRRRRLHLAAGEALDQRLRSRRGSPGYPAAGLGVLPGARAAELAWHFLEGDDPERALPYALLAGDQAEAVFAHEGAERQYRTALELARELEDGSREAEALEKLGVVLSITGRYDQALEVLEEAAHHYNVSGDQASEGRVIAEIGRAYRHGRKQQEGIARLEAALEALEGTEHLQTLARLWSEVAALYFWAGRYDDELAAAQKASDLARTIGDDRILAWAETRRATALTNLGHRDEGLAVYEGAIPVAESAGDIDTLSTLLNNLGFAYFLAGDFSRSRAYRDRALELARTLGDPDRIAFQSTMVCQELYAVGRWQEARQHAERAVDSTRTMGPTRAAAYALAFLGWVLLAQGEWEPATEVLEESLDMAEAREDLQARVTAQIRLAELDLLEGRAEGALARLQPLLDRLGPEAQYTTVLLPTVAWAHLEAGDRVRAEEIAAQAVGLARARSNHWILVDGLCIQGMLRAQQTRWSEAEQAFEEAVSLAHGMPYPYAEARALQEWGMMYLQQGARRLGRGRLEQALALFRQLGARWYIERTEQALANLD